VIDNLKAWVEKLKRELDGNFEKAGEVHKTLQLPAFPRI
jgi:hypothetical protein